MTLPTTNKIKEETFIQTNFPCMVCGEYNHYKHHFPHLNELKWLKEVQAHNCSNSPYGHVVNPSPHPTSQPIVLQNHFPQ